MGFLENIWEWISDRGYIIVVEISVLAIYLLLYKKMNRLSERIKDSLTGYFSMHDIKKDSEIKRACIELTTNLDAATTMIFRLHNGESAGDFFHFKKTTAIFDEPRRDNKLRMEEWKSLSYGIFADRMEQLFTDGFCYGHIDDLGEDYSYRAFHRGKGIYYEILFPIYIRDGKEQHPFGYIGSFFNKEQAKMLRADPDRVAGMLDDVQSVRSSIENKLVQEIRKPPFLEAMGRLTL